MAELPHEYETLDAPKAIQSPAVITAIEQTDEHLTTQAADISTAQGDITDLVDATFFRMNTSLLGSVSPAAGASAQWGSSITIGSATGNCNVWAIVTGDAGSIAGAGDIRVKVGINLGAGETFGNEPVYNGLSANHGCAAQHWRYGAVTGGTITIRALTFAAGGTTGQVFQNGQLIAMVFKGN